MQKSKVNTYHSERRPCWATTWGWSCSDWFKNLTEKTTIGTFKAAKMPSTAEKTAEARCQLKKRCENNTAHNTRKETSLGSQRHQVFQADFPQIIPVIKTIVQKSNPTDEEASAK